MSGSSPGMARRLRSLRSGPRAELAATPLDTLRAASAAFARWFDSLPEYAARIKEDWARGDGEDRAKVRMWAEHEGVLPRFFPGFC
eukprot:gene15336-biopygen6670